MAKAAMQSPDVIARLDRATPYSRADRESLEYWATRSSRVVTVLYVDAIDSVPFHFPITQFQIRIDRVSVSQHGTALLIVGAIPTLIAC
jgi:hypothetical protein